MRSEKPLAFLRAVIDDSASEIGERRLFMAGYLNRAELWALFADAWAEELSAAPSIEYLKMSEAQNLKGQFDRQKGWTETKRDEKLRSLVRVIRHFQPMSFQMSINREYFYRVVEPVSPRGLANPYFSCSLATVATLAKFAAETAIKHKIEFIFDQQDGVSADMDLFFEYSKLQIPKEAQKIIDGRPIYKNDRDFTPLQAADMLVWHLRREHELKDIALPMADLLRSGHGHVISEIPEAVMDGWAAHHSQQPGVPFLRTKHQWRAVKSEIKRFEALGIDTTKITKPGIYYPRGTHLLIRAIDRMRRLLRRG